MTLKASVLMDQDQENISLEIVKFYKDLYETFERINVIDDNDFFNEIQSISGTEENEVVKPGTLEARLA